MFGAQFPPIVAKWSRIVIRRKGTPRIFSSVNASSASRLSSLSKFAFDFRCNFYTFLFWASNSLIWSRWLLRSVSLAAELRWGRRNICLGVNLSWLDISRYVVLFCLPCSGRNSPIVIECSWIVRRRKGIPHIFSSVNALSMVRFSFEIVIL